MTLDLIYNNKKNKILEIVSRGLCMCIYVQNYALKFLEPNKSPRNGVGIFRFRCVFSWNFFKDKFKIVHVQT